MTARGYGGVVHAYLRAGWKAPPLAVLLIRVAGELDRESRTRFAEGDRTTMRRIVHAAWGVDRAPHGERIELG
jgi:hypothetical protein